METKTASAIKDLIVINNDRCEGYRTAAGEAKDADLKSMFQEFSSQSERFAGELRKFLPSNEQPSQDETKNTGKLYRVWMDVKSAVTANNRKQILASCEYGEDHAVKHYKDAVEHPENAPTDAMQIIQRQYSEIQKGHDKVKSMRDSA